MPRPLAMITLEFRALLAEEPDGAGGGDEWRADMQRNQRSIDKPRAPRRPGEHILMTLADQCVTHTMPSRLPPQRFVGAAVPMKQKGLLNKANVGAKSFPQANAEIHVFAAHHRLIPAANFQGGAAANGNIHSVRERMERMRHGLFWTKHFSRADESLGGGGRLPSENGAGDLDGFSIAEGG